MALLMHTPAPVQVWLFAQLLWKIALVLASVQYEAVVPGFTQVAVVELR